MQLHRYSALNLDHLRRLSSAYQWVAVQPEAPCSRTTEQYPVKPLLVLMLLVVVRGFSVSSSLEVTPISFTRSAIVR